MSSKNKTVIKVTNFGQSLLVRCDLSQASSPIEVNYLTGCGWDSTPLQCADVSHNWDSLARYGAELLASAVDEEYDSDDDYEYENIDLFVANADTSHDDARDWYDAYGWCLTTEQAGDVRLHSVDYDWLDDDDDDAVVELLMGSVDGLSDDEAAAIVKKARSIRDVAEEIESSLNEAVEAYEERDYDACVAALDAAEEIEGDGGDTPATSQLRSALLADLDSEILSAVLA